MKIIMVIIICFGANCEAIWEKKSYSSIEECVTASAPVTTNTCGIKINITPKDVMYINDLIATGTMTCTINLICVMMQLQIHI
mgnify:CR=1 FL=1